MSTAVADGELPDFALGRTWGEAIEAGVRAVGDGILITTGILAGGFLCMTVSSSKPTADFGMLTCFTIVTGAFLDIIIDPILLGFMAPYTSLAGCSRAPLLSMHGDTARNAGRDHWPQVGLSGQSLPVILRG